MNLRKFYMILSIIVAVFLFAGGIGTIYYLNAQSVQAGSTGTANDPISQIFQPFIQSKEPFNILLLGGDKVNKNSDTMMLVNFDPSTCKVNIMSIPRDTKVIIDNNYRKINYAYPHAGIDLCVQTVSELLNVKIKYYVFVDTTAFRKIVDLLGGVNIDVPADMNYDDPTQNLHIHLKKGAQTLNGDQAEQFVRFRHPNKWTKDIKKYYDGSDLKRTEAQQQFIKALMDQKLNIQYLPKLNSVISVLFQNVETNFSLSEIIKLSALAGKYKPENLNFIQMPGTPYDGSPWYYICDVQKARDITAEYFKCSDSLINIDSNASSVYDKEYTAGGSGSGTKSTNSGSGSKKNVNKNNPSNSDSSLKGNQTPGP